MDIFIFWQPFFNSLLIFLQKTRQTALLAIWINTFQWKVWKLWVQMNTYN
jgi:hypothetical protein